MEELLRLTRENNQMLKRICAWLDKTESAEWQTNNDMREFVMNCVANLVTQQRVDNNDNQKQIFWR